MIDCQLRAAAKALTAAAATLALVPVKGHWARSWAHPFLALAISVMPLVVAPLPTLAQACKISKTKKGIKCAQEGAKCDDGTGKCVTLTEDNACDCHSTGGGPGGGAPDFTISSSPSSLEVALTSIAVTAITISPLNGFTGSVSLSASGLPVGVTASFSTNSTTSRSMLTLIVNGTASPGGGSVTVTGTAGPLSHSTTIGLTVQATPNQANVIFGPDIREDECDMTSPEYAANPYTVTFDACKAISYPPNSQVARQRFMAVPTGKVEFRFFVYLIDHNSPLHSTYTVTVSSRNTITGKVSTDSASIRLYGSAAPDAPSGVRGTLQANTGSVAFGTLAIPASLQWAESIITFRFDLSQGQGSYDPASYPHQCDGGVCPMLTDYGYYAGPDLSAAPALGWMPAGMSADAYVLFVTPAAQFQLPIVPVAILYAPLGNGKQAQSTYTISTTAGTNLQFNNSKGTTATLTNDEKTTYSQGVKLDDVGASYKATASWDNSVQSQFSSTYGSSSTFVTSNTISYKYTNPASTMTPLNQISCATEPFWHDEFIVAVNAQFAAWDYPGSPVVQPLGSVVTTDLPLQQLFNCATTTAPAACTSANTSDPHCLSYDLLGSTQYVELTPQVCSNMASLDPFFVARSQSLNGNLNTQPWRQVYTGGLNLANNAILTVKSDFPTNGTFAQDKKTQYQSSVTAVTSNTLDLSGTIPGGILSDLLGITWSDSSTDTNTTTLSYDNLSQQTLATDIVADTTIQDTSGIMADFIVLQDSVFQGLAVQDSDMNNACPSGPVAITPPIPNSKQPTRARNVNVIASPRSGMAVPVH